jgi:hypothetical protein
LGFVVSVVVVDVGTRLLHQQTRELQKSDPDAVRRRERILGLDQFVDEDRDDVVGVVLIRHRKTADQLVGFPFLEADGETRNQYQLEDL